MMEKVLLIDDDKDIQEMLTSLLENENLDVENSSNGKDAFLKLERTNFDTIILDIFLPDINGIDFISKLKEKDIQTPIVIITGSSQYEIAREAVRLGVYDYLIKPFKNIQFQQVVHNALRQNRLIVEKAMLEREKTLYHEQLERKVEEQIHELKESESKYHNLVEQSLTGVYIIQDSLFKYANNKLCEILEISANELVDRKSLFDFTVADQKKLVESHLKHIDSGEALTECFRIQVKTANGNLRVLEVWSGQIQYQASKAIEGVVVDVTEQHYSKIRERQLELELLNEHKLAAIGQLAAGISHNLNTPITIIQANAELLKLRNPDSPEIDKIMNQTRRMSGLINTILEKGKRDQEADYVDLDINALLKNELEFFNANLYYKHKVEKQFDFGSDIPVFKAIYSDFSQSIMNIIQNAIDAMYNQSERILSIKTSYNESEIIIAISDTGCGISDEIKSKIFDPFFTTKPTNIEESKDIHQPRGTGLGLSLVYNLLMPYKVKIDFETEKEKGTTFTLHIPIK